MPARVTAAALQQLDGVVDEGNCRLLCIGEIAASENGAFYEQLAYRA
jgi:hypothetical protein